MMKLSDAIRLGAMTGPQLFGRTMDFNDGTCALGAAIKAIGRGKPGKASYAEAFDHWPITHSIVLDPVTGRQMLAISIIRLLNDEHRWTREAIADQVEMWEQEAQAAPIADQPVAVAVLA